MANKIENVKKNGAVQVKNGMIDVFPQLKSETPINIAEFVPEFNGCYATNNSTICFVSDNEIFVSPYTRDTMSILRSAGFCEKNFYVPFSNGDYPKAEQSKWNALRKRAHQSYKADFVSDCEAYCEKHNIGSISEATLKDCFEMPENGVRVTHHGFEDTYYPILNQSCLDYRCENLGHYCCNNGCIVFISSNGKTYVTRNYKILTELRSSGYTESPLFVPFSNGEQIEDYCLNARWNAISN